MLRQGIEVVATVHDAVGVVCTLNRVEETAASVQAAFTAASQVVLGRGIRSKVNIVRHPDRYRDDRGVAMWATVMRHLGYAP
jgi:hypothetical protein